MMKLDFGERIDADYLKLIAELQHWTFAQWYNMGDVTFLTFPIKYKKRGILREIAIDGTGQGAYFLSLSSWCLRSNLRLTLDFAR